MSRAPVGQARNTRSAVGVELWGTADKKTSILLKQYAGSVIIERLDRRTR